MFWASTNDDGCHFGHHCCWWTSPNSIKHKVNKNILISTLVYWFYQNPSTAALEWTCARPPATRTVWIHQIHAAGGASGSITMVVVFVGCLCCCGWTRNVTCKKWYKNNLKTKLMALLFDPPRRAPHHLILRHEVAQVPLLVFLGGLPGSTWRCRGGSQGMLLQTLRIPLALTSFLGKCLENLQYPLVVSCRNIVPKEI